MTFIEAFSHIPDKDISARWRYGELLLDSLNMQSGISFRRYHFNRFESNYGIYFKRFFHVTLFLFTSFNVILNAIQGILTGCTM